MSYKKNVSSIENITNQCPKRPITLTNVGSGGFPLCKTKNAKKEKKTMSDIIFQSSSKINENVKNSELKDNNFIVPVDKECKIDHVSVLIEGSDIYDVMLNQTNVQFNNNKFYIIQLLKDNNAEDFFVWMRWGRVAKVGQSKLIPFNNNVSEAKKCFCKKYFEKTENVWEKKFDFQKINGKYDLLRMDYVKSNNSQLQLVESKNKVKLEPLECKLDLKIQDLLKMIFDVKEIHSLASDLHYDASKLPLGRLTEDQIKLGYTALMKIEEILNDGNLHDGNLLAACNVYYTSIPHDFGMKKPPLIQSMIEMKKELELLETLSDIKITFSLLDMGDDRIHSLDRHYQSVNCEIKPIAATEDIYKLLSQYLNKTHGPTHNDYSCEMLDLFELKKDMEWINFEDLGNKILLWHGSRTTNYGSILSQGLRISPPEAPVSGHMFGKGVYFADISSKSANYIYSSKSKNIGFLLLCEVSLGTCHKLIKADYNAGMLQNSVMGCGIIAPNKSTWVTIDDDVVVPVGDPIDTGLSRENKGYLLNYNEYVIYNRNQIKMRYMIKVRFNYK